MTDSDEVKLLPCETFDWNAAAQHIRHQLEMALARHAAVGAALTFGEGEKLITTLSASIIYDLRRSLDPSYDA